MDDRENAEGFDWATVPHGIYVPERREQAPQRKAEDPSFLTGVLNFVFRGRRGAAAISIPAVEHVIGDAAHRSGAGR